VIVGILCSVEATFGSPIKDLLTKFGFAPVKVLAAAKDRLRSAEGRSAM
jgi:hypothetical protein